MKTILDYLCSQPKIGLVDGCGRAALLIMMRIGDYHPAFDGYLGNVG